MKKMTIASSLLAALILAGAAGQTATISASANSAPHNTVFDLRLTIRLGDDPDAAQVRVKFLIERLRAGPDAAQARLTGIGFTDNQFFHMRMTSCFE